MLASNFPEVNGLLGKPDCMTDDQCYALPVHHYKMDSGLPGIISCWRFNREEWQEMGRTGQIWCNTVGQSLAPFSLHGENPFLDGGAWVYHPTPGQGLEAAVHTACMMADERDSPVDFFFNGVTMRVYPGQKVPAQIYVEYYKAKKTADHYLDAIHAANGRPVPKI